MTARGASTVARGRAPAPRTIACWRIDLDQPENRVAVLAEVLSPDERDRAARFVAPRDRRRFIVTRACLRALLARACDVPAAAIRFAYAPLGKPSLAAVAGRPPVHFSVSHSEDLALVALARDLPLGVDVEAVRPVPDFLDIASRYFTAAEANTIAAVPVDERDLAFFLCWTRKEAFSKARGDGLSLTLERYRVTCRPGEPARILEIDGSAAEAAEWSVHDLRPAPGFVGAAVMRAAPRPLSLIRFDVEHEVEARHALRPRPVPDARGPSASAVRCSRRNAP
jgi:4'-phosphopantetheinyl transferase